MAMPRKDGRLHALQGTTPEWVGGELVVYRGGRPRMPKDMPELAQQKWREMCRLLTARQTLTAADGPLLETYCMTYARWRNLLKHIEAHGEMITQTFTTKSGEPYEREVPNPACKLVAQLDTQLRLLYKELCTTPASRARVKPTTPTNDKKKNDAVETGGGNTLVFGG